MLSIICVFNKEEILNKYLLSSLSKQSFQDYEIILIDSVKMNFKSAAKALNYAVNLAKGEVYIFVHQDIKFLSDDVLNKINGVMVGLKRKSDEPYKVEEILIPIEKVMLDERKFPMEFISENKHDVTESFIKWLTPLVDKPTKKLNLLDKKN